VIVLADNDLILKLAKCNLLDSLPNLLGIPIEEIFIAPAARFQLVNRNLAKAVAKCGNQETLDRICAFLGVVKDIPGVEDTELLIRLGSVDGIDSGEQLLFASCFEASDSLLVTGDRTALRALAGSEQLVDICHSLAKRVVTFESALLLAAKIYGFDVVKAKLLAYPGYEKEGTLKYLVREDMTEANFEECLVSYSREVAQFLANPEHLPISLFELES
jgi:hypothetical protein